MQTTDSSNTIHGVVGRRLFTHAVVLTLLLVGATANVTVAAADKRPNVVVFLTDDQGWGDLGCYGHKAIKSPNLDKFASQGMRFTQAYAACSVCSPSRSSILTGRTPYRNGVWRWIPGGSQYHLRSSEITIATLLKQRGYATCHAGKWHLNGKFNSPDQPQPNDHGYDWWLATQNNASPHHMNPTNYVRNGEATGRIEGPSAVIAANEAIHWLKKQRGKDKPFFITVWTHEPHLPIESAPKFMEPYKHLDDEGLRQHHGNITQLDHAFGELMKALDELGEADNTFVIFTSDNGPEGAGTKGRTRGSTGGLRGRKRHTHEGGIRVPGIVRWPGHVKPGSVSDTPIIGSDIFTTICDIVDIPLPSDRVIDGASMLPAFQGQPIKRDQPLYWRNHLAPSQYRVGLRDGDWKIVGSDDLTKFELYNIKADWQETTDLAEKHPDVFTKMKQWLIAHDKAVLADGPDWWKNDSRSRRPRGKAVKTKGPKLGAGKDETGNFDETKGCTVTKGGLGYELRSQGEGLALKKLQRPITGRVTFELSYKATTNANTRNACLVFGDSDANNDLIKAGTMIGMGAHGIFEGTWNNVQAGQTVSVAFDTTKTFHAVVTVDVPKRTVTLTIDGKTVKSALPESVKQVAYYGYYIKNTSSTFSAIKVTESK